MKKIYENLDEARRIISSMEHLKRVNYNLLQSKPAVLRIIEELTRAVRKIITAMIQFDYVNKLTRLTNNPKTNFNIFLRTIAPRYKVEKSEISLILEILEIEKINKKTPMIVLKKEKLIIFSETMEKQVISLDKIEQFTLLSKKLLEKAKIRILS
jgi:hypothetical protein